MADSNRLPQHAIIGMIHLLPLLGTPAHQHSMQTILERAMTEAEDYLRAGIDALMIENMHDLPYLNTHVGPEIVAQMTVVAAALRKLSPKPLGIQILAGANKAALAVAAACQLDFIRAEGFVFSHIADEGQMDACAGELLRYRKHIDAQEILIFTDIKKKHSAHSITADVDIQETAQAAEFFRSDGLIITGSSTGKSANLNEIKAVKSAVKLPVLIGSGVDYDNVQDYLPHADAMIIGSYFKDQGHWQNQVNYDRCASFMDKVQNLKENRK